jgi:hypothetical protein
MNGYDSNYCCGGEIPITTDKITRSATSAYQSIRAPVSLRWDFHKKSGQARYVHFPLDAPVEGYHTDTEANMFKELLEACDPATFGLSDRDVLDEQYRKAGKLDANRFSTSFHSHDYGIVDTIS